MRRLLTLLSSVLLPILLTAQPDPDQRFAAFAYAGPNFAQVDGDYYSGYNKFGMRFGVGAHVLGTPKWYTSIGLGFAQGGARPGRSEKYRRGNSTINLRINTVEVPLLFNYRLGDKTAYTAKSNFKLYRSIVLHLGVALSRVTGTSFSRTGSANQLPIKENFVAVEDSFVNTDMYWIFGATVQLTNTTGVYFQHGKSVFGLYRPGDVGLEQVLPLYPYYLNLGVRYVLY
ncbi:hypothetical protein LEM8419_01509 [Neolewinella maritima]|uniref:Outer membrane protein beta-barrel domain-containing protein n=1 Tax=Neolewinella maritima TaxID=1383882 RepID=A0ABN8F856_9BACT|nr:outer membrane beta-barrel protein [Neolewinella maritima]CAH1000356.1 hypothetical protein LEM8419_01509 [Neolewinella maritima]